MLRKSFAALLMVSLMSVLAACSRPPEARGTAISNVTVIDAVHGVRDAQTVIFDGDEIIAVGSAGDDLPAVKNEIDGSGRFLIPGLWDMHVHLTFDERFTASMPASFLYYGITSVRDTGGMVEKLQPVIAAMRAKDAHSPRVWWSGPLQDGSRVVYDGESRPLIGQQNASPAAARDSVLALADAGVDFIKIYELVRPDVFEALAAAARERNLPIAAHVPLSMTALYAGPEVDSMEHLRNVELACAANAGELLEQRLSLMAEANDISGADLRSSIHALQRLPAIANYDAARCADVIDALAGTIQVPTLRLNAMTLVPPFDRAGFPAAVELLPAEVAAEWRKVGEDRASSDEVRDTTFGEWSLRLSGDMNRAGVPIGAGTDAPIGIAIPGYSLHSELEMLVRAGLSPLEALQAATVRPAQFFGLEDKMGTIAPGMRADLLLLNANPLDAIANTREIDTVVSQGRVMPRGYLLDKLRESLTAL